MSPVPLVVLLGGARAGKSSLAVQLAATAGRPVVFVATATAGDEEMAARIADHRRRRPAAWTTREEPVEVGAALAEAAPDHTVVLDCLTLWVSNLMEGGAADDAVLEAADAAADVAARRAGLTVVVSNEVGTGIVPADALSRRYRDLLGAVNTCFSARADRAYLVVAGRVLPLERLAGP